MILGYLKRLFAKSTHSNPPLRNMFNRQHLEYAFQAAHSILSATQRYRKKSAEAHEDLLHVPYEEALKQIRPLPLAHWRFRGDFIYIFKITHGFPKMV